MKKSEIVEMVAAKAGEDGMEVVLKSATGPVSILAVDKEDGIRAIEVLRQGEAPSGRAELERSAVAALARCREDLCGKRLMFARASLSDRSVLRIDWDVTDGLGRNEAEEEGARDPRHAEEAERLRPMALDVAARWYARHSLYAIGRNYTCRAGSIDLVLDGILGGEIVLAKVVVVPEGAPDVPAPRPSEAQAMREVGESWLKGRGYGARELRFDVLTLFVAGDGRAMVRCHRDALDLGAASPELS